MRHYLFKKSGFTLLEIILVVALLAISSGVVAPIYYSAKNSDDLINTRDSLISSLRRAQLLSMAVKNDETWGLKINNQEIIVFQGNDFFSRNQDYDEIVRINRNINVEGIDEIVFLKLSGRPSVSDDFILTSNNKTIEISVNQLGIVDY